jgi:hypothetical protein
VYDGTPKVQTFEAVTSTFHNVLAAVFLSRNNPGGERVVGIAAIFHDFRNKAAGSLCSPDCVAERQEFELSFPFLLDSKSPRFISYGDPVFETSFLEIWRGRPGSRFL